MLTTNCLKRIQDTHRKMRIYQLEERWNNNPITYPAENDIHSLLKAQIQDSKIEILEDNTE